MGFTTIALELDQKTRDRIENSARRLDRTTHWLIEQAIYCYLDHLEQTGNSAEVPPENRGTPHDVREIMPQSREERCYQPFLDFAPQVIPRDAQRVAITAAYRSPESEILLSLLEQATLPLVMMQSIRQLAHRLADTLRRQQPHQGRTGRVQRLLQAFSLSSQEGIALMCLAEALLRIPDTATRDALIRDKISRGDWHAHLGKSRSLFVNAATWGLLVTGKLVATHSESGLSHTLSRLLSKGGEPLIRKGMDMAMRVMGEQFVTGETIDEALTNAHRLETKGFRYSYDMLGEAALTEEDAKVYLLAYQQAIHAIGKASQGRGIYDGPGISIKLSALHPRYCRAQYDRVQTELYPTLLSLTQLARQYDIGINIDAEEAERLDISLDLLEKLCDEPSLAGWNGIGFVVQAYQKRCPWVIDRLITVAQRTQRRLMVRLVKGAYWDSEIKRAQTEGLDGYPVYTRKLYTDIAYLACARKLLAVPTLIYPQFATHNAYTLSAIYHLAGDNYQPGQYEFQCLHGMGETLYTQVVGEPAEGQLGRPCRIYAPVGTHERLLAYLVRRLLENGANTSFVNRIADTRVSLEQLIADPVTEVITLASQEGTLGLPHPHIPLPCDLYGSARRNSQGIDLTDDGELAILSQALLASNLQEWRAAPMLAAAHETGAERPVINPADHRDIVGYVSDANEADVRLALDFAAVANLSTPVLSLADRVACLQRAAMLMENQFPTLIALLVREAGKTVPNAIAEIREAVDFLRYYAQQASTMSLADHAPLGMVVCISPWNFPLAIFTGQIAAALVAGNRVLAKPAEQTPLIAAQQVRLLWEAGVPPDMLQLLPGVGETVGAALVADPRVQGVMFTGSTAVAKVIQRQMAGRMDEQGQLAVLIAETGGLNAMIVDSSALTEQVVNDVMMSAFDSAGQRCSALRLLCLQEEIADSTLTMLRGAMAEYRVGHPDRLTTDCGPLIDKDAVAQIEQHLQRMRDKGYPVFQACHHRQPHTEIAQHGSFILPTLIELDAVADLDTEVFGPVLHVVRYARHQLTTLVDDINALGYGLTLGVHSRIDETITYITQHAHAGNHYVNRNMVGAVVGVQPFGGERLSGTGPKAGGPLYLLRLLAQSPDMPVGTGCLVNTVEKPITTNAARDNTLATYDAFITWARDEQRHALVSAALQYRIWSEQMALTHLLPGPTGEHNTWHLVPRTCILCLADEVEDALLQLAVVLAVGGISLWPENAALLEIAARFPDDVRSRICFTPDWLRDSIVIDAVICHGDRDTQRRYSEQLAQRDGPIVPLIGCAKGSTQVPLVRLWHERVVSVNTAAAGGNASLLMIEG